MTIWLYCICRNESALMPYFLRHYDQFVNRMTFFDDGSDDGTQEIISGHKNTVLQSWPGTHGIVDDEFTEFANEQWKQARGHADWVIWVDADEFLYHPRILDLLAMYLKDGVEVPQVRGYTMLSDSFPTADGQITDLVKTGMPDCYWAKCAIFRVNIAWHIGKHSVNLHLCNPRFSPTAEIKLLHYRGLGLDWVRQRHERNWARVPDHCRARNYGNNTSPGWEGHHGLKWFKERLAEPKVNVI